LLGAALSALNMTEAMSRHISLQRTQRSRPACHYPFPVVETPARAQPESSEKGPDEKTRSPAETLPPCPKQNSKIRVDSSWYSDTGAPLLFVNMCGLTLPSLAMRGYDQRCAGARSIKNIRIQGLTPLLVVLVYLNCESDNKDNGRNEHSLDELHPSRCMRSCFFDYSFCQKVVLEDGCLPPPTMCFPACVLFDEWPDIFEPQNVAASYQGENAKKCYYR